LREAVDVEVEPGNVTGVDDELGSVEVSLDELSGVGVESLAGVDCED
jgi:hypothetical protein